MGDRFTLQWADYQKSVATTFVNAKISQDFTDVTLVGKDFELNAHRLVLSSGSDFFQRVFNRTKHHHPFVYIHGIQKVNLESVLSFLYNGEAIVAQDDLEQFILTSKELGVRGVLDQTEDNDDEVSTKQNKEIGEIGPEEREDGNNQIINQLNFKRKSSAWSYFQRLTESLSVCKMCGKEVQTKSSNTSGLWRHMSSAHKDIDIKNEKSSSDVDKFLFEGGSNQKEAAGLRDDLTEDKKKDFNQQENQHIKITTKKLQAPRSRIWEQFKRLPEDLAVCKICNRNEISRICFSKIDYLSFFRILKTKGGSTTGLWSHFEHLHQNAAWDQKLSRGRPDGLF